MQYNFKNLIELFEDTVKKYPTETAIKDCNKSFSYLELYQYACHVCNFLNKVNAIPGERIVCISKKNAESIIVFWGILLSGGVPVMLEHDDGVKTNEEKINVVKASIVICDMKGLSIDSEPQLHKVYDFDEVTKKYPSYITKPENYRDSYPELCYILLTSGTSGQPKAVQVSHSNVLHYTHSIYQKIGTPEKTNAAHVTTFAADLGLTNLLVALISGGMLRIFSKEESTDPALFTKILEGDNISLLKMTPSHLLSIMSNLKHPVKEPIKYLILGGEKLSWETVDYIRSVNICEHLYNHYGPTETTIGVTVFKVEEKSAHSNKTSSVPIGQPIGQGYGFLHSETDRVGELYITGPGVSKGYFENETENENRFVTVEINGIKYLCFRTGDLCKRLADDNFEFLYRTDRQVKIRGYRIELGEVEQSLLSHPDVESANVMLSDDLNHGSLEAYVRLRNGISLENNELRAWLLKRIPSYKIPSSINIYNEIAYNANGKIDLQSLRKSFLNKESAAVKKPQINTGIWKIEAKFSWEHVLNKAIIAESDNFFEIGGDSLLAIQVIGRLQRHGFKTSISDINNNPTYRDFISLDLPQSSDHNLSSLFTGNHRTHSQKSFLLTNKFNPNSYCQSILFETKNRIRIREFSIAVNYVINNHLQLSTVFLNNSSYLGNNNFSEIAVKATVIDDTKSIAYQIQQVNNKLSKEISISDGHLFKANVFVNPKGDDLILFICHHSVIDVISWSLIIDEFTEYYDQLLNNISPQINPENSVNLFYEKLLSESYDNKMHFALNSEPLFLLPDSTKNSIGLPQIHNLILSDEVSSLLRSIDEKKGSSTISGLLLSALGKAILKKFNIAQISIDIEFHGRQQNQELPDLSRSVAWWSVTMPLNLEEDHLDTDFCSILFKNKSELSNSLNLLTKPQVNREDLPDIRFNYLGHFPEKFGNSSIEMIPSSFTPGPTRDKASMLEYKIFFTSRFIGSSFIVDIQYQNDWFTSDEIGEISNYFYENLQEYLKEEHTKVDFTKILEIESNSASVGQPLYNLKFKDNIRKSAKEVTVFITGVTGFLGTHILNELLKYDYVKIICLVRGEDQYESEKRLNSCYGYYFNNLSDTLRSRIQVLKGDITHEKLGMIESGYDMLIHKVDLILHVAADINLMKDYKELENSNVNSIKNIIAFAETGKIKEIHYVSTLAVSGYSPGAEVKNFSEYDFEYDQEFISDYEKTKFKAEKLVRKFFSTKGSGSIYRSGHIAAHSVTGKFQRNAGQNRIFQIIQGFLLIKQIPDSYGEHISFSHVDIVAKGIVNQCLNEVDPEKQCFHMENPYSFTYIDLVKMLNRMGYKIEVVSMSEFRNTVADFDGTQKNKEIVDLMFMWIQRFTDYPRQVNYLQGNTLDILARSGIYFPETTLEWFIKMIDEGINLNYFDSPLITDTDTSLRVSIPIHIS